VTEPARRARSLSPLFAAAAIVSTLGACTSEVHVGTERRCLLGVHATPIAAETRTRALEDVEALVGGKFAVDREYLGWDASFTESYVVEGVASGHIPFLSWSSRRTDTTLPVVPWADVADETNEPVQSRIRDVADTLATLAPTVLFTYQSQPEDEVGLGTPEDYVRAWQRVATVIRERAPNVVLVTSLKTGLYPVDVDRWYPGDDYVDWIGASGWNWYTGSPESPWRTFASIFVGAREWAAARGKPFAVTATASSEHLSVEPGSAQAKDTWVRELAATVEGWPEVQCVIFWNGPGETDVRDWRIDSSEASLVAFREIVVNPYFDVSAVQ